jgi:hypothetical protein
LLVDRFGRHPREGKRRLELRIGLAFGLDQRMNVLDDLWEAIFRLVSAARREVIRMTLPGVQFMQSFLDRVSPPTKHGFGMSRAPVAILNGHLRLKLTSRKTSQLLGCGAD